MKDNLDFEDQEQYFERFLNNCHVNGESEQSEVEEPHHLMLQKIFKRAQHNYLMRLNRGN